MELAENAQQASTPPLHVDTYNDGGVPCVGLAKSLRRSQSCCWSEYKMYVK